MTYKYPAMTWLIKKDPDAALVVWREVNADHAHVGVGSTPSAPRYYSIDDAQTHDIPDEPLTSETMCEPVQDGPDELNVDALHEIRPSVDEMLSALGWIEWPWCGQRVRREKYRRTAPPGYAMRTPSGRLVLAEGATRPPHVDGHMATIGGLTFYLRPKARRGMEGGLLLSYRDGDGREQRPAYKGNKPRGGKKPHRTKAGAEGYLFGLHGAVPSPMAAEGYQRHISGEPALIPMLTPQAGVEDNRATLARAYANTPILPPVTICPPAIAKGACFIGGMVGAKQTASVPAPHWQEREVKPLSLVLEEVAARGTLADVGVRLGYRGGSSDRAGGKALVAEGRALLAANDNNAERKIAA